MYCRIKEEPGVGKRPLSPTRKNKRGQLIHKGERLLIVNLYKNLKEETPDISKIKAYAVLSKRTGFGMSTIRKTLLEYERTGNVTSPNKRKHRIPRNQRINECDKSAIRRKVHQFYINKELPTLAKVLQVVNSDAELPNFKRTNFWKLLKELNFTYVRRRHNSVLIEKDDLILRRRSYLKAIRKFREDGRPIYYLDETWINAGEVSSKVWTDTKIKSEDDAFLEGLYVGPFNPNGKAKWLTVLHIGSATGFLSNGFFCFESKKNTANYYDEINCDIFRGWFEKILPSLEDNAVIVMNNALYSSVQLEKIPNALWKKAAIVEWLQGKGKSADITMLKPELLQIVALVKGNSDKYVIEQKAKEHNKTLLKLPPYHCEFNPMEMAWSMVKGHVTSNNNTFETNDVKILIEQGVDLVTAEHWNNFVTRVTEEEERFWKIDEITDKMIDEIPSVQRSNEGSASDNTDFSDIDD